MYRRETVRSPQPTCTYDSEIVRRGFTRFDKTANASARKVYSIDAASDDSDSDLSTKRRKRKNTKGERNRMDEQYNRKKGRAIIKQKDYKQVIRRVLRIKRNKALQTQFRLLYQVLQLIMLQKIQTN